MYKNTCAYLLESFKLEYVETGYYRHNINFFFSTLYRIEVMRRVDVPALLQLLENVPKRGIRIKKKKFFYDFLSMQFHIFFTGLFVIT